MANKKSKKQLTVAVIKGKGAYSMAGLSREAQRALEQSAPRPKRTGTWQNAAARATGGLLGSAFGPVGSALGSSAGGALSRFLGYGKYTVSKNTLVGPGQMPFMHNTKESIVLRHREYIGDVISSATPGTFSSTVYQVNPGLYQTFPWGSVIAQQFQEYRLRGAVVEFKTKSADALNSTNTALGSVIIASQYNVKANPFTSKFQMENEYYATDCKPSESMYHAIECDPKQSSLSIQYVRSGNVQTTDDLKEYDWCNLTVATTGVQGTSVNLGELWMSYEVQLFKPALVASIGLTVPLAHYYTTTQTNAAPLNGAVSRYDSIGATVTGNVITFPLTLPLGYYRLTVWWYGTGISWVQPTVVTSSSFQVPNFFKAGTQLSEANGGTTTAQAVLDYVFNYVPVPGQVPTITFGSGGTLPSSPTGCDIIFMQFTNGAI